MEIREARPTDIQKILKVFVPNMVYGCVAEKDGEIVGGAWVVWGKWGRAWACLHSTDELRASPVTAIRAMKRGLVEASKYVPAIYAAEENERLLRKLRFVPTGEEINGRKVSKWQKH